VQPELEALRHDRALEGEEDEGEGREDDIGDHGSVVSETRTSGDEVEIHVVSGGVIGQREPGGEDDNGEYQDSEQRISGAVGDADVGADREVREIRDTTERGNGDHAGRPLTVAARRESEGVILERFLGRVRCMRQNLEGI